MATALEAERDWAGRQATSVEVPADEQALWAQIADEIDSYLAAKATPSVDLFGEVAVEPLAGERAAGYPAAKEAVR